MIHKMRYRGYEGSALYSAEDKFLHVRLLGIRDTVIYDGQSIPEMEKYFRGAVNEYLAFCEAEGKTPNVPFKGSLNGLVLHNPWESSNDHT